MKQNIRVIAFLTVLAMALVMLAGCGGGKNADDSSLANLEIGDVINYGSYKQTVRDGMDEYDLKQYDPEPIQWRMVDKRDGFGLFVSEKVLDCVPYNASTTDTPYADSELRKFLVNDFWKTAFSSEERKIIKTANFAGGAGGDTRDKVFCLSAAEAKKYFPGDGGLTARHTDYAHGRGVWHGAGSASIWWLRDNGLNSTYAKYVEGDGTINNDGYFVSTECVGVRPAVWIRLGSWPKGHGPEVD